MSFIDSIAKNPVLKAMLMKQLKSAFSDPKIGLHMITISMNAENGELDFGLHTEKMRVLPETEFNNMVKALTDGI